MARGLEYIPDRMLDYVGCDLFSGDPVFAGIWRPEWSQEENPETGLSYRESACCSWPYHMRDGSTTVVLPTLEMCTSAVVVHELGHVLHWNLAERAGGWDRIPSFEVVTEYALTDP